MEVDREIDKKLNEVFQDFLAELSGWTAIIASRYMEFQS